MVFCLNDHNFGLFPTVRFGRAGETLSYCDFAMLLWMIVSGFGYPTPSQVLEVPGLEARFLHIPDPLKGQR